MPQTARPPQQARSQGSTDRMLDAVETIIGRGVGLDGVTIAAVSQLASVSVGALYHRFGDRAGLLSAAQNRFLTRLEQQWLDPALPIWTTAPDAQDDHPVPAVSAVLQVFEDQRTALHAFLGLRDRDQAAAARGTQAFRRVARFVVDHFRNRYGVDRTTAVAAFRILFGQALLIVFFEPDDLSTAELDRATWHRATERAVRAVLFDPTG